MGQGSEGHLEKSDGSASGDAWRDAKARGIQVSAAEGQDFKRGRGRTFKRGRGLSFKRGWGLTLKGGGAGREGVYFLFQGVLRPGPSMPTLHEAY